MCYSTSTALSTDLPRWTLLDAGWDGISKCPFLFSSALLLKTEHPVVDFSREDPVDPSVLAELPKGSRVISTEEHGISFWGTTGRINVELADGTPVSFFIKAVTKERGKNMVYGEDCPDTHFFLCGYRDMAADMPDPDKSAARLAALHNNSASPTGKFGFHVVTHNGNLPQMTDWEDSWEIFFAKSMRHALDLETAVKGWDPELDFLVPALFERVIPRLLRPLESEGWSVKPSLIHGDLWYANSGIDTETGESLVFDACCFYAYNECELAGFYGEGTEADRRDTNEDEFGQWRPICNRFGDEYLEAYRSYAQILPPEEDYDGQQILNDIRDLVARYGSGVEYEASEASEGRSQ
ncbi:Fructosamine kinase-domain-containing protein [Aspergillus welwitschiae]|uniref:protein-ribulosamine 3-kinase n=1 Tax=Aspergillus welwitschiae TaxID=1341132 RepID=A0A3F3Q790_9EURO|nr:Fructosamine kinase-domain-containing protein [Aspergillus welwitschiae]RDH35051.1 Fructosamine kinase-domain-containing protein [Aspergillus welwitschiae]